MPSPAQVVWGDDTRYPGPEAFGLPDHVTGVPTQAELDAQPRLFTWGELKEMIRSGELEHLSRNKQLQGTYEKWMQAQREKWGSAENYLINARLPWGEANRVNAFGNAIPPEPTYDQRTALNYPDINLTPSTRPRKEDSNAPAKHRRVVSGSGSAAVAAHALGLASQSASGTVSPASPTALGLSTSASASAIPSAVATAGCSRAATAPNSPPGSGASTPSSVAYVSLDSVLPKVNRRLERQRRARERAESAASAASSVATSSGGSMEDEAEADDDEPDVFLKFDPKVGLDRDKYAVLPNDWPYCVPYGVRHYCLWSRVPIAHPVLVNYDRKAWEKIENEGLGGFTGVIPAFPPARAQTQTQLPTPPPGADAEAEAEAEAAATRGETAAIGAEPKTGDAKPGQSGRAGPSSAGEGGWYAVDVEYGGSEMRRWAGVTYEAVGGHEVGNMVRGLWDERGWETIWFVNPASVPGYAHFHIFARRKTPTEIDISEKVFVAREREKERAAEKAAAANGTSVSA